MGDKKLPVKSFAAGETLIKEGRQGKEMYILNKGKVEVLVDGVQVAVIDSKGSFIGEVCALMGSGRIATVRALVASEFYVIDNLSQFFVENPESGFLMAKTLASRLMDMNRNFVNLKKAVIELMKKADLIGESERRDLAAIQHAMGKMEKGLVGS